MALTAPLPLIRLSSGQQLTASIFSRIHYVTFGITEGATKGYLMQGLAIIECGYFSKGKASNMVNPIAGRMCCRL